MEHMYGLQWIVEGFESAHTARAELQLDSAVNRQGESIKAELAFGVHIHNTFDSLFFFIVRLLYVRYVRFSIDSSLLSMVSETIQSGHFPLSFPFCIQIAHVQTHNFPGP